MTDKNLILVKMIKKYPCLYNHHLPEYFKKEITEKTWSEVGEETNMTVGECKEKWKNLRYSFVRSLKLNRHGASKKHYYLKDEMEFVLPYVRALPSILTESASLRLDSDTDEDNIDNNQQTSSTEHADENKSQSFEPPKKRTKTTAESTNHKCLHYSILPQRNDEEARKMFLLSLLPEVAALSETQMRSFRRKVLQLIDDLTNESPYLETNDIELKIGNSAEIETVKREPT